jgi:hypothetical protein
MKALRIFLLASTTLLCTVAVPTQAQSVCTKHHGETACDWKAFRPLLESAQTVAIRTGNIDRFTGVQLKELAKHLHKSVVEGDADLGMEVVSVDSNGIIMGPGDSAIAELRIYAKAPMTGRYELVWVEHFEGDRDRPWASSVQATIDQFEDRVHHTK